MTTGASRVIPDTHITRRVTMATARASRHFFGWVACHGFELWYLGSGSRWVLLVVGPGGRPVAAETQYKRTTPPPPATAPGPGPGWPAEPTPCLQAGAVSAAPRRAAPRHRHGKRVREPRGERKAAWTTIVKRIDAATPPTRDFER